MEIAKKLSHAMALTIAALAFALNAFVGNSRMGMQAKTNFVAQAVLAMHEDHIQTKSS